MMKLSIYAWSVRFWSSNRSLTGSKRADGDRARVTLGVSKLVPSGLDDISKRHPKEAEWLAGDRSAMPLLAALE
jgi:hypothetical protein